MKQQDSSGFWKVSSNGHSVCTTSGMRAWWLSKVRGYKVQSISQMPRVGSFGRMTYYRRWVLEPANKQQR